MPLGPTLSVRLPCWSYSPYSRDSREDTPWVCWPPPLDPCHCHWPWCCSGWAGHGHQLGLHRFEGQACAATTHRFVTVRGGNLGRGCGVKLSGISGVCLWLCGCRWLKKRHHTFFFLARHVGMATPSTP